MMHGVKNIFLLEMGFQMKGIIVLFFVAVYICTYSFLRPVMLKVINLQYNASKNLNTTTAFQEAFAFERLKQE